MNVYFFHNFLQSLTYSIFNQIHRHWNEGLNLWNSIVNFVCIPNSIMYNLFTEIIYTALYLQQWNINHTWYNFFVYDWPKWYNQFFIKVCLLLGSSAMHVFMTTYHKTIMIFVLLMACLWASVNRYFCDIMPSWRA